LRRRCTPAGAYEKGLLGLDGRGRDRALVAFDVAEQECAEVFG
jgi:hypothetical protein